tara:strand:+ start:160 stop:492 length:333 start_codon:yes stop_codon:yes gene_type:complete
MTELESKSIQDYIKIPLVGNRFQKRKPNKNDNNIVLIKEDDNIHDPNAIAVYSKITENDRQRFDKLGFVIKDKAGFVRENHEKITVYKIIRSKNKNKDNLYYYYLLIIVT